MVPAGGVYFFEVLPGGTAETLATDGWLRSVSDDLWRNPVRVDRLDTGAPSLYVSVAQRCDCKGHTSMEQRMDSRTTLPPIARVA